jgi:hypothetical protein
MLKNFAILTFLNSFTHAAEVTCGFHKLIRGWRHIKLHSHFQPALPGCTENGRARPLFMARSKATRLIVFVVSPKTFPLRHQTVTEKFFFKNVGQL